MKRQIGSSNLESDLNGEATDPYYLESDLNEETGRSLLDRVRSERRMHQFHNGLESDMNGEADRSK